MDFNDWFATFLEEKGLSDIVIEFEDKNGFNYFPIGVIREYLASCPREIQQKVKTKLVQLDFCNLNVSHFLEHLAKGIAQIHT